MSLLNNTQSATVFYHVESKRYSIGNGITRIEDVPPEFSFVYRFLKPEVKNKIESILSKEGIDAPNSQEALKALYNHKNI